jgi:hypothetical protein
VGALSQILDWARSVKADLVKLQNETGIPALFAAAQMVHESNSGGELSGLARRHNYAGIKARDWQKKFGCGSVPLPTWEEIDGKPQQVMADFCTCPDWQTWLKVYAALLTGTTYGGALQYAADPLLYGGMVGRIWATDSVYLPKLMTWMLALWPDYADTIPAPPWASVTVAYPDGQAKGQLQPDGRTWAPLRVIAEASGATVGWDGETKTATVNRNCCCG